MATKQKRLGAGPGEDIEALNAKYAPYKIGYDTGGPLGPSVTLTGPGIDRHTGGGVDGGWSRTVRDMAELAFAYRMGREAGLVESVPDLLAALHDALAGVTRHPDDKYTIGATAVRIMQDAIARAEGTR